MDNHTDKFLVVWRNIYLKSLILYKLKSIKDNRIVQFKTRQELIEYGGDREYIQHCYYTGDELLIKGDLPQGYEVMLKCIEFEKPLLDFINGDTIPDGIEEIIFSQTSDILLDRDNKIMIDTFPNSVKSVKNYYFSDTTSSSSNGGITSYPINSNITSLSFKGIFNYKIPNGYFNGLKSLKELKFGRLFGNENTCLEIGDIPNGIEKLDLGGYEKQLNISVLPESVKDLSIILPHTPYNRFTLLVDLVCSIPSTVKSLKIGLFQDDTEIKSLKHGVLFDGLTSFTMKSYFILINIELLPSTLTYLNINDLKLKSKDKFIEKGMLPYGLKTLILNGSFNYTFKINSLPPTLETLIFKSSLYNQIIQNGVLPLSLTKLILPKSSNQILEIGSHPLKITEIKSVKHSLLSNLPIDNIKYIYIPRTFQISSNCKVFKLK